MNVHMTAKRIYLQASARGAGARTGREGALTPSQQLTSRRWTAFPQFTVTATCHCNVQAAQEAFASGQVAVGKDLQATARSHGDAASSARRRANASAFKWVLAVCPGCHGVLPPRLACLPACCSGLWCCGALSGPFRLNHLPTDQPHCMCIACAACRSTNASVTNTFTLDLHGQHVDEVLASLERSGDWHSACCACCARQRGVCVCVCWLQQYFVAIDACHARAPPSYVPHLAPQVSGDPWGAGPPGGGAVAGHHWCRAAQVGWQGGHVHTCLAKQHCMPCG